MKDVGTFRSEAAEVVRLLLEVSSTMSLEEEGSYTRGFSERANKNIVQIEELARFAEFI
jgi:hypothetical protein